MKKGKEITIYDIARRLDISPATVSRALQDHPSVNKNTKKKILDLAGEMGYRTNHFASSLRRQQTKTIGIILHELNSNFITSVLAGIEKITAAEGYDLLIAHSSESFKKEVANAKNLLHKRVDGLIVSLAGDTENLDHYQPFFDKGVPVIFVDRVEQDGDKTVVVIDNMKCGFEATQHLIDQGCKRIAHVTSSLKRNVYSERLRGYKLALMENELPFDNKLLIVENLGKDAGIAAAEKILAMNPRPDGVFITNDFVAAVCMRTLIEHGVSVPGDIAMVGFNNDAIGELILPSLTTINYPGKDVGEIAARNLINHLKGAGTLSQTNTIIVKSSLIIRQSSLKKGLAAEKAVV
ncbi:MAG: LacI family transcriptional regulator [Citrobacter freundii]|nr:MAG: LacI family transcriptional regulator [Citrobacter freundii]